MTNSNGNSFLTKATIFLVKRFGSWYSVLFHTIIFVGWFLLKLELEVLLVLVSLEAIYIGIFILMAENVEAEQKERRLQRQRAKDNQIIKEDAKIDEQSLSHIKTLRKEIKDIKEGLKLPNQ